jgi:hypothetical protein
MSQVLKLNSFVDDQGTVIQLFASIEDRLEVAQNCIFFIITSPSDFIRMVVESQKSVFGPIVPQTRILMPRVQQTFGKCVSIWHKILARFVYFYVSEL